MYVTQNECGVKYIINFPIKIHWRDMSHMKYITLGAESLVDIIIKYDIKSITIPTLGCGLGGLDWGDVKKAIHLILMKIKNIDIIVIEQYKS